MPKALGNLHEHALNPFDVAQFLGACLDTLDILLFRPPLSGGSRIRRVHHTRIYWVKRIIELPTTRMYESKTKEVRMKSLNRNPP